MNLFSEISETYTPGMGRVCYFHRSQAISMHLGQVSTFIVLKTFLTMHGLGTEFKSVPCHINFYRNTVACFII